MTDIKRNLNRGSTLRKGWKFLSAGWGLAFGFFVLLLLVDINSGANGWLPSWLPTLIILFIGVCVALAVIMAINSLFQKQGGAVLLLTATLGSYFAGLSGSFLLWFLSVMLSGNTH